LTSEVELTIIQNFQWLYSQQNLVPDV
jgi:hypothetical protein